MTDLPLSVTVQGYDVDRNCLIIGGKRLIDVVEESGTTPLYVYDTSRIKQRIADLRQILPSEIMLHYAIKANPLPGLVDFISQYVDGLDVASAGELITALSTDTSTQEISFAGPGKTDVELESALEARIVVNLESANELERLSRIASVKGTKAKIAIRVNPDFELKSSGMKMSGGPKPFGIDAEQVPDLLRSLHNYEVEFQGFHIFAGSQNLSAESICETQVKTVDLALELSNYAPCSPRFINIGGGFGIPYFPGEFPLDLVPIGTNLVKQLAKVKKALSKTTLVIELGRYLVGEAGIYVTRIIDKKQSRGVTYLITDGGLHHNLAASGNFGQILRKNYPVCIGNRIQADNQETVNIVGPLCTPLDILADKVNLPAANIGDLVVLFQSGAYGLTASPTGFLSHPSALEVLL